MSNKMLYLLWAGLFVLCAGLGFIPQSEGFGTVVLVLLAVICLGFGLSMEPIFDWGPWMDIVSIYIIPIGATLGAVSWFWIMKKEDLLAEINHGAKKPYGNVWHFFGKWVVVPCALILCGCALILKIAF